MKNVTFSYIILIICISYAALETNNWKNPFTNFSVKNSTNNSICTNPGLVCKSCSEVILCADNANGTLTEIPWGKCESYETCLNGNCTTMPNPGCSSQSNATFICRMPGVFPDPNDCKMFHYCLRSETSNSTKGSNLVTHTDVCECGYSFNAKTNFCDRKLVDGVCVDYPSPSCSYRGQTEAWWENPRLYYICLPYPGQPTLYPFMYACENGKVYDEEEYICK